MYAFVSYRREMLLVTSAYVGGEMQVRM